MSKKTPTSGKQSVLSRYFSRVESSPKTDSAIISDEKTPQNSDTKRKLFDATKDSKESNDETTKSETVAKKQHMETPLEHPNTETQLESHIAATNIDSHEKIVLPVRADQSSIANDLFSNVVNDPKRHEKFVKKLSATEQTIKNANKDQVPKGKTTYTPLEQQYLEIRKKHPDLTLFVECGYRYRLFAQDAENAAKVLNIMCFMDHNMMTASVPTVRIHVHVRRMVEAGYKVGLVRQTETAALKAAGSNKSSLFTRKLDAVFSKATLMDEDLLDLAGANMNELPGSSNSDLLQNYIVTLSESLADNLIYLVAVDISTGNIVFDEFTDDSLRSQLESRIIQIQPSEFLLPSSGLSSSTERLVDDLRESCGSYSIERCHMRNYDAEKGFSELCKLISQELLSDLERKRQILSCIAALITYLHEFGLQKVFSLFHNIKHLSSTSSMSLPAGSLLNLEILMTNENKDYKGSLFWLLNHTKTKFGARLLKQWVMHPLVSKDEIDKRLDAVEYFKSYMPPSINSALEDLLSSLPDLERGLQRIHYGKCKALEFFVILRSFDRIRTWVGRFSSMADDNKLFSELLHDFPDIQEMLSPFAAHLSWNGEGHISQIFKGSPDRPRIKKLFETIDSILQGLDDHLLDIRKLLKMPSLQYTSVLSNKYLIEVSIKDKKVIPADWINIGGTTKVMRYHSPFVAESLIQLAQNQERLTIECEKAWDELVREFASNYKCLRDIINRIATMDCLRSLAITAQQPNYCKPKIVTESGVIQIENGRHPLVEALGASTYVPNSIHFSRQKDKEQVAVILTGPNMGGKSSFIRMISLQVVMAQIGSFVPAESMMVSVFDGVYTRMGARDDINKGLSTFMVELTEASEIIRKSTSNSLVIMDELGRGTSTHDGTAIAYATLEYLVCEKKCTTLFVTHYPMIADLEKKCAGIKNLHMSYLEEDEMELQEVESDVPSSGGSGNKRITFLYKAAPGHAERSYGLNVARIAGLPRAVIETAANKAAYLEEITSRQIGSMQREALFARISELISNPSAEDSKEALAKIQIAYQKDFISHPIDEPMNPSNPV